MSANSDRLTTAVDANLTCINQYSTDKSAPVWA